MTHSLDGVTTLLFDVMGTVVDVDGAIAQAAAEALTPAGLDDQAVAAFVEDEKSRLHRLMDDVIAGEVQWRGHEELRRTAVDEALVAAGAGDLPGPARTRLSTAIHRCAPWPDAPTALDRLRTRFAVVAVSNADVAELVDLSRGGGLAWHDVVSTSTWRSYKPDPAVYRAAIDLLGGDPATIAMVAAHPWDLRAAAEHGVRTAFIARPDADEPQPDDAFDLTANDLADLADQLGA